MGSKDRNDLLDSLLFAAARDAGGKDIGEYNSTAEIEGIPESLAERIAGITQKNDTVKKRFGLRRFVAVASAAAVLVCGLTIAGIAGRKQRTASVMLTEKAERIVLTYDISGIRPDGDTELPDVPEGYTFIENTGEYGMRFEKDDVIFTCNIAELRNDYSAVIGNTDNTEYFDFIVAGKYNGCVAVNASETGSISSAVYWNDGETAFELYAECGSETVCRAAQDLYNGDL